MLDLHAIYEVVTFAIGDTKAGSKMGKLQVKNMEDGTILNCILWEETLNRLDSKLFRSMLMSVVYFEMHQRKKGELQDGLRA